MAAGKKRWLTDGLDLDGRPSELNSSGELPIDFPPPIPRSYRGAADSIVFRSAPPITSDLAEGDRECDRQFPTIGQLEISPRQTEIGGSQKSAGWYGSILVHAALLILIALLLAPADFGGHATQTLIVSLGDETPEIPIPMMLVDLEASEDSSVLSEVELEQEELKPVDVSLEFARPVIKIGGTKTKRGKSSGANSGGARGSFFGIEAVGQEFVYIVDRSGSMNGARYRRAIDELKRSVRALRDDQRFFVVLFSSTVKPMFCYSHQFSSADLQMVAATPENKDGLEEWLDTIKAGGGTEPNASLRMALKMDPSAIFMLSDGEFTEPKSKKRGGLLRAGGDAYSIVQASAGSIPIHAIAFEDPRSCENMKRLAELSGGEYRFVNAAGKTPSQLLADAREMMDQPGTQSRAATQVRLSQQFGSAGISKQYKQVFANMLIEEYEDKYGGFGDELPMSENPPIDETVGLLHALVNSDPRRIACADLQDKVSGRLSLQLSRAGDSSDVIKVCNAIVNWSGSAATTSVLDRLADHFGSLDRSQADVAFSRLRSMKNSHRDSKTLQVCQTVCNQIRDDIIRESDAALARGDVAAAIKTLRATTAMQQDPTLRSLTQAALRELTMKQLIAIRDASLRRDTDLKDSINEQLEQGFENDPMLPRLRKERVDRELAARRILQQTTAGYGYSRRDHRRQQLESIVSQFPETVAAGLAREQLGQLPQWESKAIQAEAELIRMMDDTRRQ